MGIGTTTPSEELSVNGDIIADTYLYSSDPHLKTDIEPLAQQLAKIAALEPVSYTMKADAKRAPRLGLIAQDAEIVFPEVVHTAQDGMKSIEYPGLIAPLIAAVKELKAANDNQPAQMEAQAAEIETLKADVEMLKSKVGH